MADSPVALECTMQSTVSFGDSTIVFGRVVHAAVSDDVLVDGRPEVRRLRPLPRMGANEWGAHREIRAIDRIPHAE